MPETRFIEIFENGQLVRTESYEVSDEELLLRELAQRANDYHTQGLAAYRNWDNLDAQQIKTVMKEVLGGLLLVVRRLGYF